MKKALVLFLALVLVLPMALVQPAKAEVAEKPFYALGWSDFDRDQYPYLEGIYTTNLTYIGEYAYLGGQMLYGSYTDEDVMALAEKVKKEMTARPVGTRYWQIFGVAKFMKLLAEDVVYLDYSVQQLTEMFSAVLEKMKQIDCPLDGVVIDIEYIGMSSWYLYANTEHNDNNYQTNKKIYAQIVKHPSYATRIRPLLVERGFPFWPNPSGNQSEIFSICNVNKGEQYDLARSIWDTVMRIHLNNYSNEWCYEPLKEFYPEASLSDYQSHDSKSWMKLYGVTDDGVALTGGNGTKVGTISTFSYYYARPGSSFFNDHKQYASFNDGEYEASAFNGLLYDINFTRHMYSSTDTKQIAPWITYHTYDGKKPSSMAYTPYYTELLYHLGMFDPQPFLSYTYVGDDAFADGGKDSTHYHTVQKVQNEIMAELTRVAGYADRKPIEMAQYWNAEFVVSGMYANGRNIWRITPNTDEISLAAFKTSAKDPTFCVKGQTITFPGGKVLDSATISEVGSCGYWVETAANVMPVMTADSDRYEKYPSFGEDFESYEESYLTPAMMKSAYAWGYDTGRNSAANVVKAGTGKVLSLKGDVTFKNSVIPAKITAGDSYAEDQTWEITFTIPENLDADAAIHLLSYTGTGTKAEDSGIKIQNGKLSYSVLSGTTVTYKDLTDLKPGTYTVKRIMDMNDASLFYYNVSVRDASGKEIASVKDVACPAFTTISSISFGVKGADKAVTFDNYKLYPSGVATDFELYDAATGMNVKGADAETARSRSTAYRLSWLNGTSGEKTYTVMAAYYQGSTLKSEKAIKTLTMKPGCDGVETGIVDVPAGQSVKVYLKDPDAVSEPTKPTAPTQAPTTATKAPTAATKAPTQASQKPTTGTRPSTSLVTKPATKPAATKAPTSATKPAATGTSAVATPTNGGGDDPVATKPVATRTPTAGTKPAPQASVAPTDATTVPTIPVEIEDSGIVEVPDTLVDAGMDTAEKIQENLTERILAADDKVTAENIVHYNVTADKSNIPADGKISITLPYPAGTDARYTFVVVHMATIDAYGMKPGDIELPLVTNTEVGIQFVVTGLSPISVGWIAPAAEEPTAPTAPAAPTETKSPETTGETKPEPDKVKDKEKDKDAEEETTDKKDNSTTTLLIIVIATVAILAGGGIAVFFVLKKRKTAQ